MSRPRKDEKKLSDIRGSPPPEEGLREAMRVSPQSQAREEDADLPFRGLRTVAAVDQVLGQLDAQVTADGARRGLLRVGGAHEGADDLPGVAGSLDHHDQGGSAGDEVDEIAVERLALVLGVVP